MTDAISFQRLRRENEELTSKLAKYEEVARNNKLDQTSKMSGDALSAANSYSMLDETTVKEKRRAQRDFSHLGKETNNLMSSLTELVRDVSSFTGSYEEQGAEGRDKSKQ
jgi:hypothetical protein